MARLVEEVDDARSKLRNEMFAKVKSEEAGEEDMNEDKSANDEVVDHKSTSREQEISTLDESHPLAKSTKSDEHEKPSKSDTLEDQNQPQPFDEEMLGLLERFYR